MDETCPHEKSSLWRLSGTSRYLQSDKSINQPFSLP